MAPPTKHELISLVESMCEVQDRMLGARGMPEHIQRPHVDNMEALKSTGIFPVGAAWIWDDSRIVRKRCLFRSITVRLVYNVPYHYSFPGCCMTNESVALFFLAFEVDISDCF